MDLKFLEGTPYILEAWSRHVENNPAALALTDEIHTRGLNRHEVDELSGRVYGWLKAKGIGREDFVFLCLPRGAVALIAMIGVWKAGAAFTMVEDQYPPERIAFIREDCNCKSVIDGNAWQEIMQTEPKAGYEKTGPHDAAFAVYTSGTTGNPKGALHEYGNIKLIQAASIDRETGEPRLRETDRMALIPPLNFVASIRRFMYAAYDGFHLFVVPYSIIKNPVRLRQFYLENRITVTYASPSMLRLIGDPGPTIRQIQIGGEPANGIFIEGKELVNGYSMSECGFPLTEFIIDKPYSECPVGKPNNDHIDVQILDDDGREAPAGEEGEICVEAPFFRGYIHLPEQTEKALRNGLYHTGDIGKRLPDGNIVLMGRSTDMIKINGNRIEPAEIEAVAKKILGVQWCAARGFEEQTHAFVCLYYTDDIELDEMKIREQMEQYLPYYMIPAYFIRVDAVPLLPNGKMNRKALPKPEAKAERAPYEAPRTETERILCEAFGKALHLDGIGIRDNFYHLGGDSLGTMRVLAAANLPGLSAMAIFEGCTPERIAESYEKKEAGVREDPAEAEERERGKAHPLTPNQISIFDYCIFSPLTVMWNLPRLYRFPKGTDSNRLCEAVNRVLAHRPGLYTVFEFNEECSLVQRAAPEKAVRLQAEYISEAEFNAKKGDLMQPFKMIGEPLVHGGIYETEKAVYLFLEIHHIMTDGSGMQLLNGDIVRAWNGEELPPDTYYTYLRQEEVMRGSRKYREARAYYNRCYGKNEWCINLVPDVKARPSGRTLLPLSRIASLDEVKAFEEKNRISRNLLFTAIAMLGVFAMEQNGKVLVDWIFHDRTDSVRQNAFGCLFRYVPVGLEIREEMTVGEFLRQVAEKSNESLAHCAYEWSVMRDNVFEHDMMIVCYETAEIMSGNSIGSIGGERLNVESRAAINSRSLAFQIIEMPDRIIPYLMFNESIYSKEKIGKALEVFSGLLDRMLGMENAEETRVAKIIGKTAE